MGRRLRFALVGFSLAIGCAGRAPLAVDAQIVDLTYAFDAQTPYWPTSERFELRPTADGFTPGGYYYRANAFCAAEHGGTHLDAPSHFARDGASADAIPPERLIGPGAVIDVTARCQRDPDCLVEVGDLVGFEARHGRIPAGAIVLLRTGWGARWPDLGSYLGTAERGDAAVAKLRFPGLAPEAARWLVEEREIDAVGIDTASIDRGSSSAFEAHRVLAAHGVPIFENLAALDRLPATSFTVIALPLKIAGGSGGPLRIVALLGPR